MRVFRFASGKLRRTYDESVEAVNQMQRSGSELYRLDPIDWGRRVAAVSTLGLPAQHLLPRQPHQNPGEPGSCVLLHLLWQAPGRS